VIRHFRMTLHNLVGHPLMEILSLVGLQSAARWVHDVTLPDSDNNSSTRGHT